MGHTGPENNLEMGKRGALAWLVLKLPRWPEPLEVMDTSGTKPLPTPNGWKWVVDPETYSVYLCKEYKRTSQMEVIFKVAWERVKEKKYKFQRRDATVPTGGGHTRPETPFDVHGYESLAEILVAAYDQASTGKGNERHGNGKDFDKQPMQAISDLFQSPVGMAYQVAKKVQEALNMPKLEQQERELYGVIVYTAGIIMYLRRHHNITNEFE